jgi:hypothetical protein
MDGSMICLKAEIYSADGSQAEAGTVEFKPGGKDPFELGVAMLARSHSSIRAVFSP